MRLVEEIIAPYLFLKKKKKNMDGMPTIMPAAVVMSASAMLSASFDALPAPSAAMVLNALTMPLTVPYSPSIGARDAVTER